jgi:hypothetical protein
MQLEKIPPPLQSNGVCEDLLFIDDIVSIGNFEINSSIPTNKTINAI